MRGPFDSHDVKLWSEKIWKEMVEDVDRGDLFGISVVCVNY